MVEERPECIATTKAGARCKKRAQSGSDFCYIHRALAAEAPPPNATQTESEPEPTPTPSAIPVSESSALARAQFEILANELNALAVELQRSAPAYLPPAFTADGLVELVKYNLDKFTPNVQLEIVSELRRNLEGTSPKEFLDPDTWKGMWLIMNYSVQATASEIKAKLVGEEEEE